MSKKKAAKKPVHADHKKAKQSKEDITESISFNPVWIIAGIIAILIIAGAAYYFMTKPEADKVLAVVNGENIMKSEVMDQYNGLVTQYGEQITLDIALNQSIIEKLLMQEAKKSGISVSDSELEVFIDDSLQKSGSTKEQFMATIALQNMTYEKVKERIRVQLVITKFVNQTFSNTQVSEEEVKAFFDENKAVLGNQKYDDVKEDVTNYLKSQKQVKEFQAYVVNLRNKADIKIN